MSESINAGRARAVRTVGKYAPRPEKKMKTQGDPAPERVKVTAGEVCARWMKSRDARPLAAVLKEAGF